MSGPIVLKREWQPSKNGNIWWYMATIKYSHNPKLGERQLGTVTRIVDTRSPNFNKWVTSMAYQDNHLFSRKADAIAFVVAMEGLHRE